MSIGIYFHDLNNIQAGIAEKDQEHIFEPFYSRKKWIGAGQIWG